MKKLIVILLSCLFISLSFGETEYKYKLRVFTEYSHCLAPINMITEANLFELKSFFVSKVIPREKGFYEIEFTSLVSEKNKNNLCSFTTTYYVKENTKFPIYQHGYGDTKTITNEISYWKFIKFDGEWAYFTDFD